MYLRRCLLLLGCIWTIPFLSNAQLCSGSLGENIFEEGDFGTGFTNLSPPDPGIAPGYTYTTMVPPSDGFYTITNNTGLWTQIWQSWLQIRDNSSDPNGYMMVVNASISPGIFFEQTIDGLCDGMTYEFSADIINFIRTGVSGHIRPNVSFILDGVTQFTTGEIPQTEEWNTYGFTFVPPIGVNEMTLTLRNNAPGGIGNDLALDNISFRVCGTNAFINTDHTIFLCADDNQPAAITADVNINDVVIQWQQSVDEGQSWNDLSWPIDEAVYFHDEFLPGVYLYRYLAATSISNLQSTKCRTLSEEVRIEVLPITYEITDTICANDFYLFGSDTLFDAGIYFADLISSKGCDSMVTLDLAMVENGIEFFYDSEMPSCTGFEDGLIEISFIQGGFPPYLCYLNDELIDYNSNPNLPEGIYELRVEDRHLCSSVVTVDLTSPDAFSIDAGPDITLPFGGRSDLVRLYTSDPVRRVTWSPADFLSCFDCTDVEFFGAQNQTYYVEAINEAGCPATDSLKVLVDNAEVKIYIPNVFSPNGDGVNDYFSLYTFEQTIASIRSMRVFNRWGALVFEAQNIPANQPLVGWNGQVKGEQVQSGVYTYIFDLQLIDGQTRIETGTITVLH